MINRQTIFRFCREDISLIQNYDKAINDNTQTYDCHHRLGSIIPTKKLIEMGLYWNRPASELIFLTHSEHTSLHHKNKPLSQEHKHKLSKSLKGREVWNKGLTLPQQTNESNKKRSDSMKKYLENHIHPSKDKPSWNSGGKYMIKNSIKEFVRKGNIQKYLEDGWAIYKK